jgi:hypothetical protein
MDTEQFNREAFNRGITAKLLTPSRSDEEHRPSLVFPNGSVVSASVRPGARAGEPPFVRVSVHTEPDEWPVELTGPDGEDPYMEVCMPSGTIFDTRPGRTALDGAERKQVEGLRELIAAREQSYARCRDDAGDITDQESFDIYQRDFECDVRAGGYPEALLAIVDRLTGTEKAS